MRWAASPTTRTCPRASSSAACCCGCGSSSTTTSTCARRASSRASPRRWPNPGEVDFVVVREGTEGPYTGNGGALRVGTPAEIATEVSVNTAFGVERVVRDAFARAQRRPRKKLTLVHKTNVLVNAGSVWWRLFQEVGAEYPDVTVDYMHIDAAMIFMTTDPARFDVIVTDNLFGDIITDLAAAITGGIGLAASGNVNPDRTAPSMFEPVHGSAPDIAGQQKADPTAAILSVVAAARPPRVRRRRRRRRGRRHRRPRRAQPGADSAYLRGRRRDRRARSAADAPLVIRTGGRAARCAVPDRPHLRRKFD